MANNRMYLRCKVCKREFFLAKYYPNTGYYTNTPLWNMADLDAFLDKHRECSLYNENNFEIDYEIKRKEKHYGNNDVKTE